MLTDWTDNYFTPYDEGYDEIYGARDEAIVDRFAFERLQSYLKEHPDVISPARQALTEANILFPNHPSAAHVFACTAAEVGLKTAILRPLVFGLVHEESVAAAITDLALTQNGWDRFRHVLFAVLTTYAAIDLQTYKRPNSNALLWEEIQQSQSLRNAIVHRAGSATAAEARQAIDIAAVILHELFPALLRGLRLEAQLSS